jgi:hypothetical protein
MLIAERRTTLIAAGIRSHAIWCSYCSQPLSEYSLIMNDDAGLAVFHAACAAALATEIIVDLYTFFCPPAPFQQLFPLTRFSPRKMPRGGLGSQRIWKRSRPPARASISSVYTGKVGSGAGDGGEKKSRATAGPAVSDGCAGILWRV